MPHPCCGLSLRQGTFIVALLDIAGAVMGVFVSVLTLVFLTCFPEDVRSFLQNEELSGEEGKGILAVLDEMGNVALLVSLVCVLAALLQLALATYLYRGARERDAKTCQLWWKIKVVLFVLAVLLVSAMILISHNPGQLAISSAIGTVYHVYALWVVQAFIDEIRFGRKLEDGDLANTYA